MSLQEYQTVNKIMKILFGIIVLTLHLSLMAKETSGDAFANQEIRLGFCELMNVEVGNAEFQSVKSSLMVRDVWGRFKLQFCKEYGYSMGYSAIVVENNSDKDVSLPDIHDPEWAIQILGYSRNLKSIPWMSSRGKRQRILLKPFQRVGYVFGTDELITDCMRTSMVAQCIAHRGSLISNVLTAPWLPKGIKGDGLCLSVVEIGASQFGEKTPMTLVVPNQIKPEEIFNTFEVEEARIVLLLSNTSKTNIVVRGFATSSWQAEVQNGESKRSIKMSDYVARPYLKDFELMNGCTKAIVLGFPFRSGFSKHAKFTIQYKR